MAEETKQESTEESKASDDKGNTSEIIVFPQRLAEFIDFGNPYISIQIFERQNDTTIEPYKIFMYQPIGISLADSANYSNFDAGMVGGGIEAILAKAGIAGKSDLTQADLVAGGLMNTELLSGFPGLDAINKTARTAAIEKGIAVNPNTKVAFEGTSVRTFQLDFKFIAESKKESEVAKQIINIFRNYMYPEKTGALSLQYPAEFKISFMLKKERNPYMPTILNCFLQNMTTTFNPSTNSTHADGSPTELDLSLTFQETRAMVRQDLYSEEDGFPGSDAMAADSSSDSGGEGETPTADDNTAGQSGGEG